MFSDSEFGPSTWRGNLTVNWQYDNYSVTMAAIHSSAHRVIDPLTARPNPFSSELNPNPRRRSSGTTTYDMQVAYQVADGGILGGSRIQLGARNLFNADPQFVDNRLGYAHNRLNTSGRVIYLDFQKNFNL